MMSELGQKQTFGGFKRMSPEKLQSYERGRSSLKIRP